MTSTSGVALPGAAYPSAHRARRRLMSPVAQDRLIFTAWVVFIIGASSAGKSLGIDIFEKLCWLGADLAVLAFLLTRPNELLNLAHRNLIFVAWAGLAIVSTAWSEGPGISLYHGMQLLMTVLVGLVLSSRASLEEILEVLFWALFVCQIASIALIAAGGGRGAESGHWQGVFPHKNVLGHMMALQFLTTTCLLLNGWRPWLTGFALCLALVMLAFTSSATAVLILACSILGLPIGLSIQKGSRRLMIASGLLLIVVGMIYCGIQLAELDVRQSVLDGLGKDQTLTGRTILWQFANDAIASRPWLGYGYKGYWSSDESTMRYLRFVLGQDLWFFHNVLLETRIAFGVLGPTLLVAGLGVAFLRSLRILAVDRTNVTATWPLQFAIFVTMLSQAENPLFQNHSLHQFLLVAVAAKCVVPARRVSRSARAP